MTINLSNSQSVGIIALIHRLPISLGDKHAIVDMVSRLGTQDRLGMETKVLARPEVVREAILEVLQTKSAMLDGRADVLWKELLLHSLWKNQSRDVATAEYKITLGQNKKHQDEQKARMFQAIIRNGKEINKEAWNIIRDIIDFEHRYLNYKYGNLDDIMEKNDMGRISQQFSSIFLYLMEDQANLLRDIFQMMSKEILELKKSPNLGLLLKQLRLKGVEEVVNHFQKLEDFIQYDALLESFDEVMNIRIYQYQLLETIQQYNKDTNFSHLISAFAESLKVLFDILGVREMEIIKIAHRKADQIFVRGAMAATRLPVHFDSVSKAFGLLRQTIKSVDEFKTLLGIVVNLDKLPEFMYNLLDTNELKQKLKQSFVELEQKSKSIALHQLFDKLGKVTNFFINQEWQKKLQGNAQATLRFGYLITLRDSLLEAIAHMTENQDQDEEILAKDIMELLNSNQNLVDKHTKDIEVVCDDLIKAIEDARRKKAIREDKDSYLAVAFDEIDGLCTNVSEDVEWMDATKKAIQKYEDALPHGEAVPEKTAQAVMKLKKLVYVKTFDQIIGEVNERFSSQKSFYIFTPRQRIDKFRGIVNIFDLVVSILMKNRIELKADGLNEGHMEDINLMMGALEIINDVMLAKFADSIADMEDLSKLVEEYQDSFGNFKDIGNDIYNIDAQKNIKQIKEAARQKDLTSTESSRLLDAVCEAQEMKEGLASMFIQAINSIVV